MEISKYRAEYKVNAPVYGAGADILRGALLKVGTTPATDNGMLIKASGSSAIPDSFGILGELHDYSVTDDTLIDGTKFVTHPVELIAPVRIITIEFDLTSTVTCTEAVTTTTMTVTSLEDDIDAAFLYVASGTGAGQTNYLTASAAGSCTLKAAFGTNLDTTSKFIKILPRFHDLISLNSDGTKLASQAAVGAVKAMIFDIRAVYGGRDVILDPTKHAALTGLNSYKDTKFYAEVCLRDTAVNTVD